MSLSYWIFVILTLSLTGFISFGTYASARVLKEWKPEENILLLPAENIARLVVITICVGLGALSGLSAEALGWQIPNWQTQVGWGIGVGLALGVFFYLSTHWVMTYTGQRFYSTLLIEHIAPKNGRELALSVLAMCPIVVVEELLFRSLLLGGLQPIVSLAMLLFVLNVWFGLLHTPQSSWGMFGAGLAGLTFSLLFLWANSLLLPIVAHYVTNMFQLIMAMWLGVKAIPQQ